MKRLGLAGAILLILGAVLLFPAIASAQDCDAYPFCSQNGGTSSSSVGPGGSFTFSYSGGEYLPFTSLDFFIKSDPQHIGSGQADSNGNFSVRLQIPSNIQPGSHTVYAIGTSRGGGQLTVSAAIQVTGKLIPTGTNTLPLLLTGVGAVMVGGTLVGVRRRKHHKA